MSYPYDVFISYETNGKSRAARVKEAADAHGLEAYFSPEKTPPGIELAPELQRALLASRHFILVAEPGIGSSKWATMELDFFKDRCHSAYKREIFVLAQDIKYVPEILQNKVAKENPEELLAYVAKCERKRLRDRLVDAEQKLQQAFNSYKYDRFWEPIARDGTDVHIFTCGRGTDKNSARAHRTNIDKWDYQAVVDLTHFFASRYPKKKVRIEDPVEKIQFANDLETGERIAEIKTLLTDHPYCIIVGSPDVNDFAEVVMAAIHNIYAYGRGKKQRGFILVKEVSAIVSSFYRQKEANESEGVYRVDGSLPTLKCSEAMAGILVAARNPFNDGRVVVLSGFSGVATSAIAKFLTDERYLGQFREFDQKFDPQTDVEALIGVNYSRDARSELGDNRKISSGDCSIFLADVAEIAV